MHEQVAPQGSDQFISRTLEETAFQMVEGLQCDGDRLLDPARYNQTRLSIAALYDLDPKDPADNEDLERRLAALAPLRQCVDVGALFDADDQQHEHVGVNQRMQALSLSAGRELVREVYRQAKEEDTRRELYKRSITDTLTGTLNRRGRDERLKQWIAEPGTIRGLVQFDLTLFKAINDTLGHAVGDMILVRTAQNLRNFVRGSDVVHIARVGGDEMAMLIDKIEKSDEKFMPSLCDRIARVQQDKVANGKNQAIWQKIRELQPSKDDGSVQVLHEQTEEDPEVQEPFLYIRGQKVCRLDDLAVLSVGGSYGVVNAEADIMQLELTSESNFEAHKERLHPLMGCKKRDQ